MLGMVEIPLQVILKEYKKIYFEFIENFWLSDNFFSL